MPYLQRQHPDLMGPALYDLAVPLLGTNVTEPPRNLNVRVASGSHGIRLQHSIIRPVYGRSTVGSTLTGAVQLISRILKTTGNIQTVALTTSLLYKWGASDWTAKAQTYSTGTVTATTNSKEVTGAGGMLWDDNVRAGDTFTCETDDYTIDSVDDDTTIQLTEDYTGTGGSGLSYSIANFLAGDLAYPATCCYGYDNNLGAGYWIYTNNVDWIKKYTGSVVSTLAGGDDYQSSEVFHRARIVRYFGESLVLCYTTEDGIACPQRVRWSDIGTIETYTSTSFQDLLDTPGGIMGAELLGRVLVIYKSDSILYMAPVGGTWGFQFTSEEAGIGLVACNSLISVGSAHFFLGEDTSSGLNIFANVTGKPVPIGNAIRKDLHENMDRTYKSRCWSLWSPGENVVRFFYPTTGESAPNSVWIYEMEGTDILNGRWWKDTVTATGGGVGTQASYVAYEDLIGNYQDQQWVYGDAGLGADAEVAMLGNASGVVVKLDTSSVTDAAGAGMNEYIDSKALNYKDIQGAPAAKVRCLGVEFVARGGTVDVYYSTNEGRSWTSAASVTLAGTMDRYTCDFNISGESLMIRLRNTATSGKFFLEQWYARLQSRSSR